LKRVVDLNSDMGESYGAFKIGHDEKLLEVVTSASLACGFHGGDPHALLLTAKMCKERGVEVGAHPSLPDLLGFGRRRMEVEPEELFSYVLYQVAAVRGVAEAVGTRLQHVKPHGALYQMAWTQADYALAIAKAVRSLDPSLIVLAPPGSEAERASFRHGLVVAHEGFPERGYTDEGFLAPRGAPGAVLTDPKAVADRAVEMVKDGIVRSVTGRTIELKVETLCIHSDTPGADEVGRAVRRALDAAGIDTRPLGSFVGGRPR